MKTSIATVSISGTLDAKLQAIADAGYDGAEIFENDLLSTHLSAREIGAMMRDLGLACTMFQPFRDLEGLPAEQRARAFDRLERKFDVMEELGTDLLLACSSCSPIAEGNRERIVADLADAGERAARRGLRIGYEALAWGRHINDHRDAWSIVRDVDHPAIGLVLDSFHSLSRRIPSSSIGDIRPEKLFIVQVADAPVLNMDLLQWSRHFRSMPGQGDFPLDDWAEAIRRIGYDGYWSLEIFNDRFRAGSAHGVALDGYRSLRLMQGGIARAASGASALPAKARPLGVEFIEFAASHEEAEALGGMLRPLGFRPTARHRTKDVTRWQQGGINIVVNCEPEGLAHSFDVVHGASVCAIGLAVEDVPAALARAEFLRVPRFEQAVAPGEWPIPSVRGVGGSLLYFVDAATREAMWAHEFPHALEPLPEAPLLTSIDHIAQTMQYEEFLSWLLFYVALFDLEKTPQLEIADPMGLVQSQAVESADRSVRFTLNGSLAAQSLTSRFVQNYFGAGVQHVAFATGDAFAASESAASKGLERLAIPRNYHDDLEARWGLEGNLADRMAADDLLYDRDGEAEYFQFYSRAFARRVFFEVVERRGYEGYGAANAPIRLAAQARHKPDLNGL
ncbi:4-hydroxyphenylpyruvate dioxygenase [Novosphingobium aromaticivorans DSM 12444]|uniref:3-dehydroshikimate dehydratase n=1 Tax=Novosphingobium aromaticivorans (strain ATCC 700278 / DSM 12444 / CCUG 56034 / CIP 105152 / NBRC 16084 / F199) TaxID=279238 RepID=Q2G7Z7_NOVAD|nr:sugar phosphate isomerase/epimerase and 4-hydroxyphenylpyruvate domain-containing protein [Novosphingobium aromaticivorans]ABD26026.1 4-hydroxyphenylpyruvate dioxygenase [Novosphingobium aromaticivorans DSM 12444]SCY61214.1 4-hydroxyphenylpyruvate dioxygenase [Novosphingobium aromaticivorans]